MIRKLQGAASVVAAVAVVATAPAASAASRSVSDPAHDAPRRIDIVKADYTNAGTGIRARVHVRDLRLAGRFSLDIYPVDGAAAYYFYSVVARRSADGRILVRVHGTDRGGRTLLRCGGDAVAVWRPARDTVTISVLPRCLELTGTVALQATSSLADEHTDIAPRRRLARD